MKRELPWLKPESLAVFWHGSLSETKAHLVTANNEMADEYKLDTEEESGV